MARADVCFHLAAAVGVQLIVNKPLESLATNIRCSEIVFEKAHKHGTKVLVTSTSEIYGKNTSDRLGEEDDQILGSPLKSRWSYSEAKAIEEILAYTYWRQKGLPTVTVRAILANFGQWTDPTCTRSRLHCVRADVVACAGADLFCV